MGADIEEDAIQAGSRKGGRVEETRLPEDDVLEFAGRNRRLLVLARDSHP